MASCFVKVRAHTEAHPVYTRANQLLAALGKVLATESCVTYYAALLDIVKGDKDTEPGVVLLACVLQAVPIGLIQSEAATIDGLISGLLARTAQEQIYQGKYCVKVLEKLLQVQTQAAWESFDPASTCCQAYQKLITLAGDKRPAVQKQAASSLLTLLRKGILAFPKATETIEERLLSVLQQEDVFRKRFDMTMNLLKFLAGALQILPMEATIRLVIAVGDVAGGEGNSELSTQAYLALETAFAGAKLPMEFLKENLVKLLKTSPQTGGSESLQTAYIQCLTQLLRALHLLSSSEVYPLLSPGISALTEYLLSNQSAVQQVAATAITSVLLTCVHESQAAQIPRGDDLTLTFESLSLGAQPLPIQKVALTMKYLLNERFQEIIDLIFPIVAAFLQRINAKSLNLTSNILLELEKYAASHCQRAGFKRAIAAGLNTLGPAAFFSILPMQLCSELTNPDYMTLSRSWLLPIIADYLEKGDFNYFLRELFPAYLDMESRREAAEKGNIVFLATRLQVLETQIWLCFPRFCLLNRSFSDSSAASFKQMLPKLAKFLSSNHSVRAHICRGLVHIAESGVEAFVREMREAEGKFVPMLFNELLEKGGDKEMVKVIEVYPVSEDYRGKMVKKAIEKAVKPGEEPAKVVVLLDIIIALCTLAPCFTTMQGAILKKFTLTFAGHTDGIIQKKAYKLANSLFGKLNIVEAVLTSAAITNCAECARTERLRSLSLYLLNCALEDLQRNVVAFMPEILQSVPDQSTKTRKTALDLGVALAKKFHPIGHLLNYLNLVLVGLGSEVGSTKAAAMTLMAKLLSAVLLPMEAEQISKEERTANANYVIELLRTVLLTLRDSHREVVKAAMGFVKSAVTVLDKDVVASLAGEVVTAALEWPETALKEAIKPKLKFLLEKLIKKLSFDEVSKIVPEAYSRLLHYVNKSMKRKAKKSHLPTANAQDSDSENELPDTDEANLYSARPQAEANAPEQHFMNPLDLPAVQKTKRTREETPDEDVEFLDGKVVVHEEDPNTLEDEDDGEEMGNLYRGKTRKRTKGSEGVQITVSGEEFKSSRAAGDMRKPGKQQPYAYIEFNPKMLNKRKKVKAAQQIAGMVKTAKQGVFKGLKARKKRS